MLKPVAEGEKVDAIFAYYVDGKLVFNNVVGDPTEKQIADYLESNLSRFTSFEVVGLFKRPTKPTAKKKTKKDASND